VVTEEELQRKFASYTNSKLIQIAISEDAYTDIAKAVAAAELRKRNITEDDIETYNDEVIEEMDSFIKKNTVDDLSLLQKNLFYFLLLPIFLLAIIRNFEDDGYVLKAKQAGYYRLAGRGAIIISAIITLIFQWNELAILAGWIAGFIIAYVYDEKFNRQKQIDRLLNYSNLSFKYSPV
jgi:hypothetical protein